MKVYSPSCRVTTQAYSAPSESTSYVSGGDHAGLFYESGQQLIGGQQIVSTSGSAILPSGHVTGGMMEQHLSLAPSGTRASPATVSHLLGYKSYANDQ